MTSHTPQTSTPSAPRVPAILVLADGRTFRGQGFGATGTTLGEAVFTTGMTGYQETMTDPSYHKQIVVTAAPQIGNTGWNDEDNESHGNHIWVAGLVIRDLSRRVSNWRAARSLPEEMEKQGIIGISGIDTRTLVRHLRNHGSIKAGLFSGADAEEDVEKLLDTLLSPEMKSTGEVMGLADNFGAAYAKGEMAAFGELPTEGTVFVSVANRDKRTLIFPIQRLAYMGYTIVATAGTAQMLRRNGVECEVAVKVSEAEEGQESIVDAILGGKVDLILNTPAGSAGARHDGYDIRAAAVSVGVPLVTTVQGVTAAVQGIEALRMGDLKVRALQEADHDAAH